MGAQRGNGIPKKQPPGSRVSPVVKTDVVRKLEEKRSLQRAQELSRDFERTIKHIDQVSELSHEAYEKKQDYLDAAKTGSDKKINELAKKKAASMNLPRKMPKLDCSGGVCRIPKKKK